MTQHAKRPGQAEKLHNRVEAFFQENSKFTGNIPPREIDCLFEDIRIHQVELDNIKKKLHQSYKKRRKMEEKLVEFYQFSH